MDNQTTIIPNNQDYLEQLEQAEVLNQQAREEDEKFISEGGIIPTPDEYFEKFLEEAEKDMVLEDEVVDLLTEDNQEYLNNLEIMEELNQKFIEEYLMSEKDGKDKGMEENYNEIVEDTKDDIFEAEIKANSDDKITSEEEANISAQKSKKTSQKEYKQYSTKEKADYYFKKFKKLEKEGKGETEEAKEFFRKSQGLYKKAKKEQTEKTNQNKEKTSYKKLRAHVTQDMEEFKKLYQKDDFVPYDKDANISDKQKKQAQKDINDICDQMDKIQRLTTKYIYAVENGDMKTAEKCSKEINKIVNGVEEKAKAAEEKDSSKRQKSSYERDKTMRCACDIVESSLDSVMVPAEAWEGPRKFMRAAMSVLKFFVSITNMDKIKDFIKDVKEDAKQTIQDVKKFISKGRAMSEEMDNLGDKSLNKEQQKEQTKNEKDAQMVDEPESFEKFNSKNEEIAKNVDVTRVAKDIMKQHNNTLEVR